MLSFPVFKNQCRPCLNTICKPIKHFEIGQKHQVTENIRTRRIKKNHAMQHLPTPSPPRFSLPRPQSLAITFCGIFELIKESGGGGSDGRGRNGDHSSRLGKEFLPKLHPRTISPHPFAKLLVGPLY